MLQELPLKEQRRLLPMVLPVGWARFIDGGSFRFDHTARGVRVMANASIEEDGNRWLHVSVSRRDGVMPDWYLLREVKDLFAGPEALALQIVPPRSEHYTSGLPVDVAHLWVCLDGRPVPDFLKARGGTV